MAVFFTAESLPTAIPLLINPTSKLPIRSLREQKRSFPLFPTVIRRLLKSKFHLDFRQVGRPVLAPCRKFVLLHRSISSRCRTLTTSLQRHHRFPVDQLASLLPDVAFPCRMSGKRSKSLRRLNRQKLPIRIARLPEAAYTPRPVPRWHSVRNRHNPTRRKFCRERELTAGAPRRTCINAVPRQQGCWMFRSQGRKGFSFAR